MTATQLRSERYRLNKQNKSYGNKIYRLGDWISACGEDNYKGEAEENEANFTKWNNAIERNNLRLAEIKTLLRKATK